MSIPAPASRSVRRRVTNTRNRQLRLELLEPRQLLVAFTPGNLVIYRVGDGSTINPNTAAPVFLDEVDLTGTVVQSIPAPTADSGANQRLTASSTATTEGMLTLSADGQYALITGYDAAVGTTGLTNTTSAAVPRVVGRVDANGDIDTSTIITDGYSTSNIRSAISTDGTDIWTSGTGTGGGVRYTTLGNTGPTTQISTTITNTRGIGIFDSQLYVSSMSGAVRLGTVGVGLPTTAGQTITGFPGIPPLPPGLAFGNDPYQFFLADLDGNPGIDTAYIADDALGLCKFALFNGTWVPNSSVLYLTQGVRGLTGRQDGNQVTVYVTTDSASNNELLKYVDTQGFNVALNLLFTPLGYSPGPNKVVRGLSFVPQAAPPQSNPDPVISGGAASNDFRLQKVMDRLVLTDGATTLLDMPFADVNSLTINGEGGNDRLTVDYAGGDPIPAGGIAFHGGTQSSSPGDSLSIVGTLTQNATYTPDGTPGPDDNDGTVMVDGRVIAFTGLEPLDMIGLAVANVTFLNANDNIDLTNGLTTVGGLDAIVVSGTSGGAPFESVALRGNTLVNISTTTVDGIDTITITSADNLHGNGNLNLLTGAGVGDMIEVNGGLTFAAGGVTLFSQQVDFNNPGSVITALAVTVSAGAGSITDGSIGVPSVAAMALDATAGSGISLGTNVALLTASTTAAGAINLAEANAIALASVTTANGPISVTAGGATGVTSVVSSTDADANDISITTTSGDMTVVTVTAGVGVAADVTLQATTGSIFDDDNDATLITAEVLTFIVNRAVGRPGASPDLDSTANSWVMTATGAGPFAGLPVPGHWVTDTNAITITSATTLDGVIILDNLTGPMTATLVQAAGAGRNVRLRALDGDFVGTTLRSLGGSVTVQAENNVSLPAGSLLTAATTVTVTSLDGADAGGSTISFAGDVDAVSMTVNGASEADTFNIRPDGDGPGVDQDTPITVNGFAPIVAPGDVLNLDLAGLGIPTLLVGPAPRSGVYSFAAAASVTYTDIESVNHGGGAVNLIIDTQFLGFQSPGADSDEIFVRLDAAGVNLLVDVDGTSVFAGADAGVNSLTVIGSDDDDRLRIDETTSGLPRFAGQTPAVDNTLIGGGTANASHLNASGDLILTSLFGGTWDASDVTIHFDGRTGLDSIDLNLITAHDTAYTSDGADSANSGNLGTAGLGGPDFILSFANLAPLNLSGAGLSLVVDASSTPATSTLTLSDDAVPGDTWSQVAGDGGFETTRFRGYDQLFVVGGDGSELIDMVGLDAASSLIFAQLHGGNTADLLGLPGGDASADTLRVRSTLATTPVVVDGDAGDDLVQLFDATPTVDNILNNVFVNGDAGLNTLTVVDSGDPTPGDTVLVTQSTIDGNTGFAGSPDVNYTNIDILNVTATAAGDVMDATFAPGSDLDVVNLSGWIGADQFFLSTTDEQIGGTATGIQTINLFGDTPGNTNNPDGNDILGQSLTGLLPGTLVGLGVRLIRPSISTLINIDGGLPTAIPNPPVGDQVGDELNLDVSALAPPVLVATLGANPSLPGVAQSIAAPPSHRPVNFVEIEDINLVDEGILTDVQMGDLYVRGSNAVDSVSFLATSDPNAARVRVNAFQGYFAITRRAVVYGRAGNDYIQMGNFNHPAEFYGEEGDDYLAGYLAADKLVGGQGRDRINASQGNNVVWGDSDPVEAGLPDTIDNRQLMASMSSGQRLESLDADILSALDGHDVMYGGPGGDSMTLGGGNDYAYGGQGADSLAMGSGDDRGYGGDGNDTLNGSFGNDLLNGGEGTDIVNGEVGSDVLIGGGGNDSVNGGDGSDLLFDGRVTYTGVSDHSQAAGDANDQAMQALLADWTADLVLNGPFTNDHDGADQLRGNTGLDTFSAGDSAEILDFILGLDTILPP